MSQTAPQSKIRTLTYLLSPGGWTVRGEERAHSGLFLREAEIPLVNFPRPRDRRVKLVGYLSGLWDSGAPVSPGRCNPQQCSLPRTHACPDNFGKYRHCKDRLLSGYLTRKVFFQHAISCKLWRCHGDRSSTDAIPQWIDKKKFYLTVVINVSRLCTGC